MYTYKTENIRVIDGDTIVADVDLGFGVVLRRQRFRLLDVDAPELNTPAGERAKQWLEEAIEGETVIIQTIKNRDNVARRGKYGRWLAILYVGARDLNAELVEQGLAKEYKP